MLEVTFDSGRRLEVAEGSTLGEILTEAESPSRNGPPVAARVGDETIDLHTPLRRNLHGVSLVTVQDPEGLQVYRHSCAHVMAAAVQELFPEAKIGIGPVIEEGFYYDFDLERPFAPEDFPRIEKRMAELISANHAFERQEVSREEARRIFTEREEHLKLEILNGIPGGEAISLYRCGPFLDLCRGPHLPSTGLIRAYRLLSVAGAYWRGSEDAPMLQRIYGTALPSQEELQEFLDRQEEARRRDHRRLGRELDLFSSPEKLGTGLILWHPKGSRVRRVMEEFLWREQERAGYEHVYTPHIARRELWERSGHYDYYAENMYEEMEAEGRLYQLKPMNCPFHILIYASRQRSYRDLPIRLAELGAVYRCERSGVLHGMMRVRGFTQDDAHIFCRADQVLEEVKGALNLSRRILGAFGFAEFQPFLSTRPEKATGSPENWDQAEAALKAALDALGIAYEIDEGAGVFYGPKIDLKFRDALRRVWQCSTIQFDFNLPERFGLEYIGEDGAPHRPYMIHRAIYGSLERFFGILLEHYGGAFPLWLAPVQVRILSLTEAEEEYARQVAEELERGGLRVEVDARSEKVGYKIRQGEVEKVPYLLIVGPREVKASAVSVRGHGGQELGPSSVGEFLERALAELETRRAASRSTGDQE